MLIHLVKDGAKRLRLCLYMIIIDYICLYNVSIYQSTYIYNYRCCLSSQSSSPSHSSPGRCCPVTSAPTSPGPAFGLASTWRSKRCFGLAVSRCCRAPRISWRKPRGVWATTSCLVTRSDEQSCDTCDIIAVLLVIVWCFFGKLM